MKYIFLIALREFAENAKTKGFWIGIFTLPVIMAISIAVSTKLSKAEPSRYFVVVDKSGVLESPVTHSIEWAHQRAVLQALGEYAGQNLRPAQQPSIDLSANPPAVDAFIAAVEGRTPPPVGFEDGRRALLLANAAYESIRTGRTVEIG